MGLFSRLLRLHSSNIPLEDFFTEVVAHLFGNAPQTCLQWLEYTRLSDSKHDRVYVSTQYALDPLEHHVAGIRPDMFIELSDGRSSDVILVESKIGSREGTDQLRRYAELLDAIPGFREKALVYITRDFDPKDQEEVLVRLDNGSVNFVQLRWHSFYSFLQTQPKTTLIDEILLFMEEYGMAQSNQFTPVDMLALSNLLKVLSMMDETMSGEVSAKFEEVTGSLHRSRANTFRNLQEHGRYLLYSFLHEGWSFWCGLGYHLPSAGVADYPTVDLFIEVLSGSSLRHEIIDAMREIAARREWYSINLGNLSAGWSRVGSGRSLQDFLSSPDHVAEIKKFFLESLDELQEIKKQYPHLP